MFGKIIVDATHGSSWFIFTLDTLAIIRLCESGDLSSQSQALAMRTWCYKNRVLWAHPVAMAATSLSRDHCTVYY